MKGKLLLIALALCLMEGKALAQESATQPAANEQVMPDTTDLTAMFDYIKAMQPSAEQAQAYQWLITKMKAANPVDRNVLARVICNYALLLTDAGKLKEAQSNFQEALAVTQKMMDENDAKGWMLDAIIRLNSLNAIEANDPDRLKKRTRQCDVATSELDHFLKDNRATSEEIADFAQPARTLALMMSTLDYHTMKQYDKVLSRGARCSELWNSFDDETKQNTLYFRYMVLTAMCQSAEKRGLEEKFRELAKDVESFLGNVSEQLQAGKVSVDDQTRNILVGLCTIQMHSYAEMRDFERSEQIAALASTFDQNSASIINYERCKNMILCGKEEDARKLHAEVLKDNNFVSKYLNDGDYVKDELAKFDANGGNAIADHDLSDLTNSIAQDVSQMGGAGRITIQGMTKETLAPRQERNGRVILPIDHVKQIGVGISFRIGR